MRCPVLAGSTTGESFNVWQKVVQKFTALAFPSASDNRGDLMSLISIGNDFASLQCLLNLIQSFFDAPKIFQISMFFLAARYGDTQRLKNVFKLPKEASQMRAANYHVDLRHISKGLLFLPYLICLGLEGGCLCIDANVSHVIGGIVKS